MINTDRYISHTYDVILVVTKKALILLIFLCISKNLQCYQIYRHKEIKSNFKKLVDTSIHPTYEFEYDVMIERVKTFCMEKRKC